MAYLLITKKVTPVAATNGIPTFKFNHLHIDVVRYADEVLIETALYWGGKCIAMVVLTPDEAAKAASTLSDLSKLAAEADSWTKGKLSDQGD